jgi:hypothetical protein
MRDSPVKAIVAIRNMDARTSLVIFTWNDPTRIEASEKNIDVNDQSMAVIRALSSPVYDIGEIIMNYEC